MNIGAGVGGGFENTKELRVMKYDKAVNGPDGVAWKAEVKKEHQQMVFSVVFKALRWQTCPNGQRS